MCLPFSQKRSKRRVKSASDEGSSPNIHNSLKNYFRQYSGHFNEKGDQLLSINFLWNKYTIWDQIKGDTDQRQEYRKGYYAVLDGCSHYWQVTINLTTIERFSVNGVA